MNADFFTCPASGYQLGASSSILKSFVTILAAIHCQFGDTKWPKDSSSTVFSSTTTTPEYDFIVVGAGTTGSVVAARLAENSNVKVLLVETGPDPPLESEIPGLANYLFSDAAISWYYGMEDKTACQGWSETTCGVMYGKMLGGSMAHNMMHYLRGTSRDYDEWLWAGNPTWGWLDVLPYFKKTEKFRGKYNPYRFHGERGELNVEPFRVPQNDQLLLKKAAGQLGHSITTDFTNDPSPGFGKLYGTLRDGRRMTTAKALLLKEKTNLHIIKNSQVTQILFDTDKRASSVYIDTPLSSTLEKVLARKEVIVCAGPIETSKLLMMSGIGPKAHLEPLGISVIADLPVGQNLQDHIGVEVLLRFRNKISLSQNVTRQEMDAVYSQLVHGKGPLGAWYMDFTGFIATDGNPSFSDIQLHFIHRGNITHDSLEYAKEIGENMRKYMDEDKDRVYAAYLLLQKPKTRGTIRLKDNSYFTPPIIDNNYFEHKEDVWRMIRGLETLMDFEKTDIFRKLGGEVFRHKITECDAHKYRSDKYWECYIKYMSTSFYNHAGATKMGPSKDKEAVVSAELEVHGVKGLRVIGTSIMPTITSVDTTIPQIMIAEKGVDFIKRRWKI